MYSRRVARPIMHPPAEMLAAALSVFFSDGIGVSTARIAAAAGVSNGTLFHQFPTKQALIDALYLSIKTDLADTVGEFDDADPLERRMRQLWDRLLAWARANPEAQVVGNLLHDSDLVSADAVAAGYATASAPIAMLVEAQASGLLVDLPLQYLTALIRHHLDEVVAAELDDEQVDIAFHVLWSGITVTQRTEDHAWSIERAR